MRKPKYSFHSFDTSPNTKRTDLCRFCMDRMEQNAQETHLFVSIARYRSPLNLTVLVSVSICALRPRSQCAGERRPSHAQVGDASHLVSSTPGLRSRFAKMADGDRYRCAPCSMYCLKRPLFSSHTSRVKTYIPPFTSPSHSQGKGFFQSNRKQVVRWTRPGMCVGLGRVRSWRH